jgi:hypothetical protein
MGTQNCATHARAPSLRVHARCSGPVPASLRGHRAQGVDEKPSRASARDVTVLAAVAPGTPAVALAPVMDSAMAGLVTLGVLSVAGLVLWRIRSKEPQLSAWERSVGIDELYVRNDALPTRTSPRRLVKAWGQSAGNDDDDDDDDWLAPEASPATPLVPLRARAGRAEVDAEEGPLPNAATLHAEALQAELEAWDNFNARAARAARSRDDSKLTGTARDKQKRLARLKDEEASASQAVQYRRRLQDAITAERAEAARLDAQPQQAVGKRAAQSATRAGTPRPFPAAAPGADLLSASGEQQRQRLEQLKSNALKGAALAAEAKIEAASRSSRPAGADELARKAESEWAARAEAYLRVARRDLGGGEGEFKGQGAADRFRQRLRDNRTD